MKPGKGRGVNFRGVTTDLLMSVLSGELGNRHQKKFKHIEGCLEKASIGKGLAPCRQVLSAGLISVHSQLSELLQTL